MVCDQGDGVSGQRSMSHNANDNMNLHQWSVDQGDGVSGQRSMSHNANEADL